MKARDRFALLGLLFLIPAIVLIAGQITATCAVLFLLGVACWAIALAFQVKIRAERRGRA